MPSDKTRGTGYKLKQKKFYFDMRKSFFPLKLLSVVPAWQHTGTDILNALRRVPVPAAPGALGRGIRLVQRSLLSLTMVPWLLPGRSRAGQEELGQCPGGRCP